MKSFPLGSQGLYSSRLGLGCMGMSEFYGPRDDEESMRTIQRAFDLGITFFDTADIYGPFTNEELVGKAIRPFRNKIVLATKFGIVRDPANPAARGFNGKPDYVFRCCENSLKRLNTEIIDLYYLHRKDPATPIEDTVEAMSKLVQQGKVKAIGLSEVSSSTLKKAHAIHPVTALQTEYSLWSRDPEEELLSTCKKLGIAFVAYSPLGRGFLTGRIKHPNDFAPDDFRRNSPRFQGENFEKNLKIVERLGVMAQQKGCTTTQLALAWVLAQGDHIFPIPGTKRVQYLEENLGALSLTITKEELDELDLTAPKGATSGLRYPEAVMKNIEL